MIVDGYLLHLIINSAGPIRDFILIMNFAFNNRDLVFLATFTFIIKNFIFIFTVFYRLLLDLFSATLDR